MEVGGDGDNGGLALVLAALGWRTTCSGLQAPTPAKLELHQRHGVDERITYERLDVLSPPTSPSYDLVVVKSTLGHVGQDERFDLQRRAVRHLHALVRPGGELWVLENGAATRLHRMGRRRLGAGRYGWRYLTPDELDVLLAPFASRQRASFGVAGAGGRTQRQRAVLGRLGTPVVGRGTPAPLPYVLGGGAGP
ncbi:MAG: class I SAM-dependent methyltransferase, partial [Pseudorhodobacter sp.]|nr:class I SAM-dependent methyltransferase [Frankiaceae bacterium]